MSILIRSKGVDTTKPHIVKRNTDGKYAIRQISKEGTVLYLTLNGKFNKRGMDIIDMPSGRRDWRSAQYQPMCIAADSSTADWTNNLRALRKVLNYDEQIIEGIKHK